MKSKEVPFVIKFAQKLNNLKNVDGNKSEMMGAKIKDVSNLVAPKYFDLKTLDANSDVTICIKKHGEKITGSFYFTYGNMNIEEVKLDLSGSAANDNSDIHC